MYPDSRGISDLEPSDQYVLRDGRIVYIVTDEDAATAEIFDAYGETIGAFRFRPIEGSDNGDYWHHLTWQYLDAQPGYTRQGIGREVLKRVIDHWSTRISAGEGDGSKSDWGDHLEGDGSVFVAEMREAGLISKSRYEPDPEHDDWGDE